MSIKMTQPIVFLSSFTSEFGGLDELGNPNPLGLRYRAWSEIGEQQNVWVAECSDPGLINRQPLEVVDRLLMQVRACPLFVCLLGGARRGELDSGTPIALFRQATVVSHLEAELFAAALSDKPIWLLIMKDFDPGPQLRKVLDIVNSALPNSNVRRNLSESQALAALSGILMDWKSRPANAGKSGHGVVARLLGTAYEMRGLQSNRRPGSREVFFLDNKLFRSGVKPDKELVEEVISAAKVTKHADQKFARLWIALRELGAIPPEADKNGEFLILWDLALRGWISASAWYGLHGHNTIGHLPALYSLAQIRRIAREKKRSEYPEELLEYPGGSIASSLYSLAKKMATHKERVAVLEDGLVHLEESIREKGHMTVSLAHMTGSYQLALGQRSDAIDAFTHALEMSKSDLQKGISLSELGFCLLGQGRIVKATKYLEHGTDLLRYADDADAGFYVRSLKKLAIAYSLTGRLRRANDCLDEANEISRAHGLYDQIRSSIFDIIRRR